MPTNLKPDSKQDSRDPEKRRRGRPETRRVKIDSTPEGLFRTIFAGAKKPDPSLRKKQPQPE